MGWETPTFWMSQTEASPLLCAATREKSRSRTGSASALNMPAIRSASCAESSAAPRGGQGNSTAVSPMSSVGIVMGEIIAGICVLCHRSGHNVTSAISKALSNLITAHAAKRSGAAERHPGLARPAPCHVAGAGVCGPEEVRPGIAESVSIRFPARESAIPGPSRHAESVNQGSAGRRNQLSRITGNRYWRVKQLCLIGIDAGQWRCVARGRRRPPQGRYALSSARYGNASCVGSLR